MGQSPRIRGRVTAPALHPGPLTLLILLILPLRFPHAQFIQQGAKLIGPGASGIANQASALAISGDGGTAILGGPFDSAGAGAAWIFVRSDSGWVQQGEKLVGSGSIGGITGARQGTSVGLSFDGNRAIIGGSGDNGGAGASWIFSRSGTTWSQEGAKLVGTGAVDGFIGARQGSSVALSGDGNTAIVGGPLDSSGWGGVWVFTRTGGVWSQQGPKISSLTASGEALQGFSVALSGDGSTAIVGGIYDFNNAGAAWIFIRSGSTWTQQGFKLYGLDALGGANQGWSVALSAHGDTAAVGGSGDDGGAGAVWVFTRSSGIWSQEGGKLVGAGAAGAAGQGTSLALSGDGATVIVGGPNDSAGAGALWTFTLTGGGWSQEGNKLRGRGASDGEFGAGEGSAVALSADGRSALVGGPTDNGGAGAAWAFSGAAGGWVQVGNKLVGRGAEGNASQGESVALSHDGTTLLVGGPSDSTGSGAAWAFARTGSGWIPQGGKLTGRGGIGSPAFGTSVSLSGDGNTAAAGGPADSNGAGAAWIFTRTSGSWQTQGVKIRGSGAMSDPGGSGQGTSVALSPDGATCILGGPGDRAGAGGAWVFARVDSAWHAQGGILPGTGDSGRAAIGTSVALSSDGNTALVGGPGDASGRGAAWVFIRSAGSWTQQGTKLTGSGAQGASAQGTSVALSADGNTALIGGPGDSSGAGAAWIFTREGTTWSQQGGKLLPKDGDPSAAFGRSVSISGTGALALIGGPGADAGAGGVWLFTAAGGSWKQSGTKMRGAGATDGAGEGASVSFSADGATFALGGPLDNSGTGAAWVFAGAPSPVPAAQGRVPAAFLLEQNYPNPFNPVTTIRFTLGRNVHVRLAICSLLGEIVAVLADAPMAAGSHTVTFDGSRLASGVYLCSLSWPGGSLTVKLLLIR